MCMIMNVREDIVKSILLDPGSHLTMIRSDRGPNCSTGAAS